MPKIIFIAVCCLFLGTLITACMDGKHQTESNPIDDHKQRKMAVSEKRTLNKMDNPLKNQRDTSLNKYDIQVVAKPDSIPVLVNKQNKLPVSYTPNDLIKTNIPFIVSEKSERNKMRKEAASAIEKLFNDAGAQGIQLLGVSAYRSHSSQETLFNYYVKRDGYEKARTYSALPGTSEHETGLAIDITGGNGQCPAQDCFGHTKEAKWLQKNAADYGFIIRYPKGKESITGYKYEPWHLRFVGSSVAKEVMSRGITLEEYYHAVPVNQ